MSNLVVHIQPGVLLRDLAADALAHGLMYPPDPGEKTATVGGNVSTNAGGMRAVKYGVTRDYVLAMTVVLPSGEIIKLGKTVCKTSSGYSLLHLMIGSEGTLGIITELTMAERPAREWADICLGLERMDGRWTALLEGLREVDGADVAEFDRRYPQTLREYENLLWYFFYRHFLSAADSGSVAAPLRFAAVSWQIIHALDAAKFKRAGAFAPADRAEHARLYSAEIEYSDENMEAMLELLQ